MSSDYSPATLSNSTHCERCNGRGELTYLRERPGGPPALNTMPCPTCRPNAVTDVTVFSNEPLARDIEEQRRITPMKPNRRSRRRAAAIARRRR